MAGAAKEGGIIVKLFFKGPSVLGRVLIEYLLHVSYHCIGGGISAGTLAVELDLP